MFELMLFSRGTKHNFVMLPLVLPLLCAEHPLWMDCGGWLCVFSHTPHLGDAQRRTVCEILTLIGTMQSYPLYPPSCNCNWLTYSNLLM